MAAQLHPLFAELLRPYTRGLIALPKPSEYKPFALSGRYMEWPHAGPQQSYTVWDRMLRVPYKPMLSMTRDEAREMARGLNAEWRADA